MTVEAGLLTAARARGEQQALTNLGAAFPQPIRSRSHPFSNHSQIPDGPVARFLRLGLAGTLCHR